jgi:hypothetical protein
MYAYIAAVIALCISNVAFLGAVPTKPQPVKYEVKYWKFDPTSKHMGIPGKQGFFIHFYDEQDQELATYRYNKPKKQISLLQNEHDTALRTYIFTEKLLDERDFPLDLSHIFEKSEKQ